MKLLQNKLDDLLYIKRKRQKIETPFSEVHHKMWHELPFGIFMKLYELDGVKHRFTIDTTTGKRSPIEKLVGNQWKRI
jgi:hypothetical protein